MRELRELAAQLLGDGLVHVVIGWEEGPRGLRPTFVTKPADAERLVFDARAVHNLIAYLNPRRSHVKRLGKPAIVVKRCDAVAAATLVRESQVRRDEFVLIGVRCQGVLARPEGGPDAARDVSATSVAPRCAGCQRREPTSCDYLVGPSSPVEDFGEATASGAGDGGNVRPSGPDASLLDRRVEAVEAMTRAERWTFWSAEFERCTRCYACRQACPTCCCERCVADKTVPQWIESSPHLRGNIAWHLTRALHQAGRCSGCGECERACPVGIPLTVLNRKLGRSVGARFGAVASDDPSVPAPIGKFALDDPQEFIL